MNSQNDPFSMHVSRHFLAQTLLVTPYCTKYYTNSSSSPSRLHVTLPHVPPLFLKVYLFYSWQRMYVHMKERERVRETERHKERESNKHSWQNLVIRWSIFPSCTVWICVANTFSGCRDLNGGYLHGFSIGMWFGTIFVTKLAYHVCLSYLISNHIWPLVPFIPYLLCCSHPVHLAFLQTSHLLSLFLLYGMFSFLKEFIYFHWLPSCYINFISSSNITTSMRSL